MPLAWKRRELIPIHKKEHPTLPGNYVPNTLLSHAKNVVESAIKLHIETQYTFSVAQLGFQRYTGIETALVRHIYNSKRLPSCVVLNLRKAYDLAPRRSLISLTQRHLDDKTSAMISIFLQTLAVYTRGDLASTTGNIQCGVPQGSPPSPTLFNLVIDDLAATLIPTTSMPSDPPGSATKWNLTMFADDVKLQETSRKALEEALRLTNNWSLWVPEVVAGSVIEPAYPRTSCLSVKNAVLKYI